MTKLTAEQIIYLLYAKSYEETDTVTKGAVKSRLPYEWKEKAEEICDGLQKQELIKQISKGRLSVTEEGLEALVKNLAITDYKFNSLKGPKILNTLLTCIKHHSASQHLDKSDEGMSFDEFQKKFKVLYFEERRQQELRGVVAIQGDELRHKFMKENSIPQEKLVQYFELLKSTGRIFAVSEKGNELIQWVE